MEDEESIFPLNTNFNVTDDDNTFLIRATLTLESSSRLPSDVVDQLFASSNDRFNVSQNGTSQLQIDAIGPQRLVTFQSDFVNFLKTIQFTTNDQAPEIVRNLSIVVEEFPIGEAPSSPAYVSIMVTPVNDRPILNSSQITETVLNDYLSSNRGFNSSFLVSDSDVIDIDRLSSLSSDFIGLAIVSTSFPDSLGAWQYWSEEEMDWINFPENISSCYPFFVTPDMRIRFAPQPNLAKEDGTATIVYRAWDGSSREFNCMNDTPELTAGKSKYTYYIYVYLLNNTI